MNLDEKITDLTRQLESLRKEAEVAGEPEEVIQNLQRERDEAVSRAEQAEGEANKAKEALANLKASIDWTMGALQIRDILRLNFDSKEMPSSAEGWLPLTYEPEDTKRLEWINKHARTGINHNGFTVMLPCNVDQAGQQEIPDIYNIRCIIDVARQFHHQDL